MKKQFRLIFISILVQRTFASFCGSSGVPFSFEVLPSGAPILGCAQPTCVASLKGEKDDSNFLINANGQADGFMRTDDKANKAFGDPYGNKLIANCSGEFSDLSCPRKDQWVGGIEYIDHPRQPLILQCCTFSGLRFSQEVGLTNVGPGEAITGGEVIRDGRQISFDVIANVRKVVDVNTHIVSYEVTVRRMHCLPDPPEPVVDFEKDATDEIVKVLTKGTNLSTFRREKAKIKEKSEDFQGKKASTDTMLHRADEKKRQKKTELDEKEILKTDASNRNNAIQKRVETEVKTTVSKITPKPDIAQPLTSPTSNYKSEIGSDGTGSNFSDENYVGFTNNLIAPPEIQVEAKSLGQPQVKEFGQQQETFGQPQTRPLDQQQETFGQPQIRPYGQQQEAFGQPQVRSPDQQQGAFGQLQIRPLSQQQEAFGQPQLRSFDQQQEAFSQLQIRPLNQQQEAFGQPQLRSSGQQQEAFSQLQIQPLNQQQELFVQPHGRAFGQQQLTPSYGTGLNYEPVQQQQLGQSIQPEQSQQYGPCAAQCQQNSCYMQRCNQGLDPVFGIPTFPPPTMLPLSFPTLPPFSFPTVTPPTFQPFITPTYPALAQLPPQLPFYPVSNYSYPTNFGNAVSFNAESNFPNSAIRRNVNPNDELMHLSTAPIAQVPTTSTSNEIPAQPSETFFGRKALFSANQAPIDRNALKPFTTFEEFIARLGYRNASVAPLAPAAIVIPSEPSPFSPLSPSLQAANAVVAIPENQARSFIPGSNTQSSQTNQFQHAGTL
ncbi:unnamed protein product [Onchocerca ochengi]|uniref:Uncharacterized protein n=1 Tax=Onchocerca ochengi TaxID=42157 RepID=A0A182E2C3_ONCOC|nr:unnamed protein product [Onchocerca ochengi]